MIINQWNFGNKMISAKTVDFYGNCLKQGVKKTGKSFDFPADIHFVECIGNLFSLDRIGNMNGLFNINRIGNSNRS